MGFIPQPLPLTKKEFDQAIASGKRTLAEIDPALWKWAGGYARRKFLRKKRK